MSFRFSNSNDPQNSSEHELSNGQSLDFEGGESLKLSNAENIADLIPQGHDVLVLTKDGSSYLLKNFLLADNTELELPDGTSITASSFNASVDGHHSQEGETRALTLAPDSSAASLTVQSVTILSIISQLSQDTSAFERLNLNADGEHNESLREKFESVTLKELEALEGQSDSENATSQDSGLVAATYAESAASASPTTDLTPSANDSGDDSGTKKVVIDVTDSVDVSLLDGNVHLVVTTTVIDDNGDEVASEIVVNDDGTVDLILDIEDDDSGDEVEVEIIISDPSDDKIIDRSEMTVVLPDPFADDNVALRIDSDGVLENESGYSVGTLSAIGIEDELDGPLSYSIESDNSGLFEIVGDQIKLKDDAQIDFETAPDGYEVQVRIENEDGDALIRTITLHAVDTNDRPELAAIEVSTNEDSAIHFETETFEQAFSDVDSDDTLSAIRIESLPENGTLLLNGAALAIGQTVETAEISNISFQPNQDWNGQTEFQWSGFDGNDWSESPASITIEVEQVNDSPIATFSIGTQSIAEDFAFSFTLPETLFADADEGDEISYSATLPDGSELPDWLSFDPSTLEFYGTPENEDVGMVTVQLIASDGQSQAVEYFAIVVQNTNDGPVASAIMDQKVEEDTPFSLDASDSFSDADLGDTLSYTATLMNGSELPEWLHFDETTGLFSGTPSNEDIGEISVLVVASDGQENASEIFSIEVDNTNDSPTATYIAPVEATEDALFIFDASDAFDDVDIDDTLTYSIRTEDGSDLPSWISINPATGEITGTPDNEQVGNLSLIISATDSSGESVSTSLEISVTNTNDGPIVSTGIVDQSIAEDSEFFLDVSSNFEDPDLLDSLSYSATLENGDPLPSWLSFDPFTVTFSGTPENSDIGAVSVTVSATDESGAATSSSFRIQVENTNDGPVASAISDQTTDEDAIFSINVSESFSDVDAGDILTYSATLENGDPLPNWLSIDSTTGELSGTPENADIGSISVKVTATDSAGTAASETFAIQVENTNDGPVASTISDHTTDEDAIFSINVSESFSDVDAGDILTYSATLENGDPLPNWLSIDSTTGELSGTPENADIGSISVKVTATDSAGATASETFAIQVVNTNDGPVASHISDWTTDEDAVFSKDVSESFSDVDAGDILTYSATLDNGDPLPNWLSIDSTTGELSGTPENADIGSISVKVTATDSAGSTASETFAIQVENTNDGPVATADSASTDDASIVEIDALANDIDIDVGDALSIVSASVPEGKGTVSIVDNKIVYDPRGAFPNLALGSGESVEISYTIEDNDGAQSTTTATVLVQGDDSLVVLDDAANEIETSDIANRVYGRDGNDRIESAGGEDFVHGGAGDDVLVGGDGNDVLLGGDGDDTISGGDGVDVIYGNSGADNIDGGAGDDRLYVDAQDTIQGGDGYDKVYVKDDSGVTINTVESSIEEVIGDSGNDTFDATGSETSVRLDGREGDDTLLGGDAGDVLWGREGDDMILGGDGNDVIYGGDGTDIIDGGAGDDRLYVDAQDTIQGGDGYDKVYVKDDSGVTINTVESSIEEVIGDSGNDTFDATGSETSVRLDGAAGDDTILGGYAGDVLIGGDGNDTITGGDGADVIYGNAGADVLDGGAGDDRLYIDSEDTVDGGDGYDTVKVKDTEGVNLNLTDASIERAYGDTGDDSFDASGSTEQVYIDAGEGNDTIVGGEANDTLKGGSGDDTIFASAGTDSIYGGDGEDTLILTGDRSEYSIDLSEDGKFTIRDTVADRDGVSDVREVENFVFNGVAYTAEQVLHGDIEVNQEIADQNATEDINFSLSTSDTFTAFDAGDTLTFSATLENGDPLPDWLTIDPETGDLSGSPENGDVGAISVKVTVSDENGASASDIFGIEVENTNDGPIASAISNQTVDEDSAFSLDASANFTDVDQGDTLSYSATLQDGTALPAWLSIDSSTGIISGTPLNEDVGLLAVKVVATDQSGATASDNFTIQILNTNDGPVADVIPDQTTDEDALFTLDVSDSFSDVDAGDTLSYSATLSDGSPLPSWLSIDSETGLLSGTPRNANVGDLEITVVANDGEATAQSNVLLEVLNTNDGPIVSSAISNQTTDEDAAFTLDSSTHFSDQDIGDSLTYSASLADGTGLPAWLSIDPDTGILTGTPENGDVGMISVTVVASDGQATASDTFSITVENTNDGPTVTEVIADSTAQEDSSFSLDISDKFVDEDSATTLAYSATLEDGSPLPSWMQFNSETGIFSGTPNNNDVGIVSITVSASDGLESTSQTFTLEVENTNDAPTVTTSIDNVDTYEDDAFTLETADSFADVDSGDVLTYSATLLDGSPLPTWLIFDTSTGTFSGTPLNADVGTINVTVTASDGIESASSSFEIEVINTNDRPVATAIQNQDIDEDSVFLVEASNHFTDYDLGDTLTYSATLEDGTPLPSWLTIDSITGELTGTPENGDVGTISVTVVATDQAGEFASNTFNIKVSNTNDGPTATTIDDQNVAEDSLFSLSVADNFSDEDVGDSLTFTASMQDGSSLPDWLSFNSETGEFSGTPTNDDVDSIELLVSASDGEASVAKSFTLTVDNTNDGPTLSATISDTNAVEDSAFSFDVSSNFSDVDAGDTLSYSATLEDGSPLPSWLTIDDATGQLSGTPENADVGTISVSVTATDSEGSSVQDTFSITIENTNDGPTASVIDSQDVDEDSLFTLDASNYFADEDIGDTMSYSATLSDGSALPSWLSIDSETGELSGTPRNDDIGTVTLKITATDGVESAETSFDLSVANTNDGPVATTIFDQTTDEDAAFSLDVSGNFSDADVGDTLTYSATLANGDQLPSWLSINPTTGELSGTPENGDVGSYSVTITATDAAGSSASDTFDIQVDNTNDGPVVNTSQAQTLWSENFTDESTGDTIGNNGAWTTDDSAADSTAIHSVQNGAYSFAKTTISSDNDDALVKLQTQSIDISGKTNLELSFDLMSEGTLEESGGWLDYFQVIAIVDGVPTEILRQDGNLTQGDGAFYNFTLTNLPEGDNLILSFEAKTTGASEIYALDNIQLDGEPILLTDQTIYEDAAFTIDSSSNFTDEDAGDTLTYSATLESGLPLPSWLSIDSETGELSGTPENGDVGVISVTVTATDGSGETASDTFSIQVENTNDGPTASAISDQTTDEDSAFSLDVSGNFSDVDAGDTLTYSATLESGLPLPSWLSIDSATGELSGTPENGDVGSISVTVTATDESGATASDTFGIQVDNTNDGPTASAISDQTTDEDAAFSLDVSGNFDDVDAGDTLTYSATLESGLPLPSWLSIDSATGELSGTPENGDVGSISITVTATDESGATASDTFGIQVDNTNDGPTASAISDLTTDEDAAFSLDVSGNFSDVDAGDSLTYSATLESGLPLPSWLSIDSATGELSGTPENGDVGSISITVTATDGSGETASDTFSIQVENTNDGPTATAISDQTTDEDAAFSLDVSGNFSDVDAGDTLTYSATLESGLPLPSWLSIDSVTGELSGTPENGDVGSISVTVTATDSTGATASDTLGIQIENTNDGPTAIAISDQTTDEDSAFSLDVSGNFSDVDAGDTLTYSATLESGLPLPSWLSIDSATGELSGTPENGDVGSISVTVTATDESGATASDTFGIQVDNTNDGPVVSDASPSGLQASYFNLETAPTQLSDIDFEATPDHVANVSEINYFIGEAEIYDGGPVDNVAVKYEGDIHVDETGTWSFQVGGDDGYRLFIDGEEVLAMDGLHGHASTTGSIELTEGSHSIQLLYFEQGGSSSLKLEWQGPSDSSFSVIDSESLSPPQIATEDSAFSLDVSGNFNDVDEGDTLTYSATLENGDPLPEWLSVDSLTGELSGNPENEDVGSISVTVTATDSAGATASDTFSIRVENTNDGPTASAISNQTTDEDAVFSLDVSGNFYDIDAGDTFTYTATLENGDDLPGWLSIDSETGELSGIPEDVDVGSISVTVTATDSGGATASETFGIQVNNTNDGPIASPMGQSGLRASYYDLDSAPTQLSDIDFDATPDFIEVVSEVNMSVGAGEVYSGGQSDNVAVKYEGYIEVDETGTWNFQVSGDDGYRLFIDGEEVLALDGLHGHLSTTGSVELDEGSHSIELIYFERDGGSSLTLEWQGPSDSEFSIIGSESLTTPDLVQTATEDLAFSLDISGNFSDVDEGDTLSYSATLEDGSPLPSWLSIDPATGEISGTPENGDVGLISITVTATDESGATASDTFGIQVDNTNDGPTASAISDQTTDEDAAFSLDVSGNFSDVDVGDTLTYSATLENGDSLPSWLSIDSETGELSGTPENGDVGSYSVTVTATDTAGSSASDTFGIQVDNTNDGPTATAISDQTATEDFLFTFDITDNFSDVDVGDNLSYEATLADGSTLPSWLSFDGATGQFSGTPDTYDLGTLEVKVVASDGEATTEQTFSILVEKTNDLITATVDVDSSANTVAENASEGTTVGVTASASDADAGDTVTYSVDDARFTVDSDGVVTVAAGASFDAETEASIDIVVTATSSDGSTSNETFTVAVSDVDEYDVSAVSDTDSDANTIAENASEGTTVGVTASASDADSTENVTYSVDDARFTVDSNGVVTVAAGASFDAETEASIDIVVTATSSDGSTSNETFTVNVSDVDEYDVSAVSDTDATANTIAENASEGTTVGVTASASDADSTDNVTYSVDDARFTVDSNGVVTVAAGASFDAETEASIDIVVTATSSDGSTSNETFTIAVSDVDEYDVSAVSDTDATADTIAENASEGTTIGVTATAADADSTDTVAFSVDDARFTVDSNGVVTVAAGASFDAETEASIDIVVTATSSDGSTSNETFTIAVSDVDEYDVSAVSDTDATANTIAENASEGATVGVTASATDADATDNVTYSVDDARFTVDSNGVVTVAAGASFDAETEASIDIVVTATSSDGSTSNETFTVNVSDVDEYDVSAITDADATSDVVSEDASNGTIVGITTSASDADATNNTVTYSITSDPSGAFEINTTTGVVTIADSSALDYESATSHTIEITATSSDGSVSSKNYAVSVEDVNETPVVSPIADQTTDEDAAFSLDASGYFSDVDAGDTLTYSATLLNGNPLPSWLSIDSVTGELSGTPENGDVGSISVTVTATDSAGATASDTFGIQVDNTNDGPTATAIADQTTDEDAAFSLDVSGNFSDVDAGDTLTYSATLENGDPLPSWLSIDSETGLLSGTPENDDVGTISVTVTATDSAGATASDTFGLQVDNVNDAPVTTSSNTSGLRASYFDVGTSVSQLSDIDFTSTPDYEDVVTEVNFNVTTSSAYTGGDTDCFGIRYDGNIVVDESGTWNFRVTGDDGYKLFIDGVEVINLDYQHSATATTGSIDLSEGEHTIELYYFEAWGDSSLKLESMGPSDTDYSVLSGSSLNHDDFASTLEDSLFSLDASTDFNDIDAGDTLTYSATLEDGTPLPSWLSIDSSTGVLSGTPENGDVGLLSVLVTVTDTEGAQAEKSYDIRVDNTNDGPTVSSAISDQSIDRGDAFSLDISNNFADEDAGDTLTYSATLSNGDPLPSWLSINSSTGVLSGTPTQDDSGTISVKVTASDGEATVEDTFDIDINAVVYQNGDTTDDTINGDQYNDEISGGYGSDTINAGAGDDTIYGDDSSNNTTSPTNYIINGSFEDISTGTSQSWGYSSATVSGWTEANGENFEMHTSGWEGMEAPTDGDYFLDMASSQALDISQSVSGLTTGEEYTLSFDAGDRTADLSNSMDVYFGGVLIGTIDPSTTDVFESYSFDIIAGSGDGSDTLRFVETGGNDAWGISLDNVKLVDSVGDTIYAGEGNDTIYGGDGDDYIDTGLGTDSVDAGAGADTIIGSTGNETIDAGSGDDTIYTGGGSDTIDAGSGDDTINVSLYQSISGTSIDGGDGDDTLELNLSGYTLDFTAIDNSIVSNIETIDIDGTSNDIIKLSASDVLDLTDSDNKLFIEGNSGDTVQIDNNYSSQGVESIEGSDYTHYYDSTSDTHLYISTDITNTPTF
ncbi:putative Ig domain-containing protein [Pelagicoccus albus]|uniref:Putative Ig domain-containing protein n=1 Tax=Pelagicoccus albus TaxID=415222 RepID=A0A7X1B387_9BACT|nr:putative Ig domain-containing protein [Pelagicoccus albus]MBC2604829.1 putative Ig domain-containing protein [Pelagicoccus albus]